MLPVVVFTTKYTDSALTAVGKAKAANKGIKNLSKKKLISPYFDQLSISKTMSY